MIIEKRSKQFRLCVFNEMATVCTTRCKNTRIRLAMEHKSASIFIIIILYCCV